MKYRVLTAFMDLQDNGFGYCADDIYPREGLEPSEERIAELSDNRNRRGIPLIECIKEKGTVGRTKKKEA